MCNDPRIYQTASEMLHIVYIQSLLSLLPLCWWHAHTTIAARERFDAVELQLQSAARTTLLIGYVTIYNGI